ncbi:MAG: hypothetical protein ACODAE_05620 [Gemmatimonadota bacterium]
MNNGAAWTGRGATTALAGGVELRWRALTVTVAPSLVHHQNLPVPVSGAAAPDLSPLAYPWQPMDWPQRHGWNPFWTLEAGQSRVAARYRGAVAGLSTENLWWGPSRRYALVLSSTAPGFPHAFVRTARPVATPIGELRAEAVWGRLSESDHFDGDPSNDHRPFGGLVIALEPRAVPGLRLGLARTWIAPASRDPGPVGRLVSPLLGYRPGDAAAASPRSPGDLRILGLFARWAFPRSGFEAYAEWAMQGPWPGVDGFLRVPGRSRAFTLGAQKVVAAGAGHAVRLAGEISSTGLGSDALRNPRIDPPSFYAGGDGGGGRQGYTHRGQLLGAWIGPGADAQHVAADLLAPWGELGLFLERVRYDGDAYLRLWSPVFHSYGYDVELGGGLRQRVVRGDIALGWTLGYLERFNRGFVEHRGNYHDPVAERGWSLELEAVWRVGVGIRP